MTERLLPSGVKPLLMPREMAAEYMSISPSYFDQLRKQAIVPPPKRLGGKKVWFTSDLDLAGAGLPYDTDEQESPQPIKFIRKRRVTL